MDLPTGIRQHGSGLQIRLRYKGIDYTQTIDCKVNKGTIALAARTRSELKQRLQLGLPIASRDSDNIALIADVCQQWLNGLDVEYSTATTYLRLVNQHWLPNFGHWPITDLKPSHIRNYLNGFRKANKQPLSYKTKKNALIPLRAVYNFAINDGLTDHNPCATVKFKRGQKLEIDRFSSAEKSKILNNLDGDCLVYFTILFETGMRPSEVLALLWTDYEGDYMSVSKSIVRRKLKASTKTNRARRVHLNAEVKRALNGHTTRFANGYIFINSHGGPHLDTDRFNGAWQTALRKARVAYRIPYTCRHTRAAIMLTNGVEPAFSAAQLGHSLEMFLRIYSAWLPSGDDAEIAKLNAIGE